MVLFSFSLHTSRRIFSSFISCRFALPFPLFLHDLHPAYRRSFFVPRFYKHMHARASPERLLILAPFPSRDCNLRFRYARRLGHPRGGTLPTYLPLAYVPNEIHLYSISNRSSPATDRYTIARFTAGFNLFAKVKNYFYFCPRDLPIFSCCVFYVR